MVELTPARPAAVVFDADGVLVDTEPAWAAARTALYAHHHQQFGAAAKRETLGTGIAGTGQLLSRLLKAPARAGELTDELLALLVEQVSGGPVRALPGALELVDELQGQLPLAVASNSPRALLDRTLQATGLAGRFDVVLGADEVPRPKPAPDLYRTAVERLGAQPGASVAIEDSAPGVAAARAAGLYVIGVHSRDGASLEADQLASSLRDPALRARLGLSPRCDAVRSRTPG